MDDAERSNLQTMVEYYRNKSYKLEHEYLLYKIQSESNIKRLESELQLAQSKSTADKATKSA